MMHKRAKHLLPGDRIVTKGGHTAVVADARRTRSTTNRHDQLVSVVYVAEDNGTLWENLLPLNQRVELTDGS